jgi:lysophospholipase
LIDAPDGGPAYTFSSIAQDDEFANSRTPFPILVSDVRAPGTKVISLNATVVEFNPFEMGSYDPTIYGFAPMRYLASNFSAGVVPSDGKCVEGFDSASFILGTSSSLFNAFLLQNISAINGVPSFLLEAATAVLDGLSENENDIAQYAPNPFLGWNNATNPTHSEFELDLVDGGEDLQNIPLHPLIQPLRGVDVIFAVDSSADTTYNWPNGTALRASYDRSQSAIANGTLFPPVPDDKTFIALGLNNRPTFFGCDPANFSLSGDRHLPPLLIYLPNAPYTAMSNVTTFTPSYTRAERDAIIRNGYNAATQGNATAALDAQWPACVACAVLSRSLHRTGTAVPSVCSDCFERYCWNGTTVAASAAAAGEYEPTFKIRNEGPGSEDKASAAAGIPARRGSSAVVGLVVGLFVMVAIL